MHERRTRETVESEKQICCLYTSCVLLLCLYLCSTLICLAVQLKGLLLKLSLLLHLGCKTEFSPLMIQNINSNLEQEHGLTCTPSVSQISQARLFTEGYWGKLWKNHV